MNIAAIKKRPVILALALCLPSISSAYVGDPVTNAVKDLGHLKGVAQCMNQRANVYLTAGLIGTGLLFYANDRQLLDLIQKSKSRTTDRVSKNVEKIGNGAYDLAFLGGVAGAGYLFKDDKLKDTAFLGAESFLAANAIGLALKYSIGRARPYHGSKWDFKPFSFNNENASFPSGHTISAFSVASVFAAKYDSLWIGVTAYGAASAVALQRINSNNHWPTDVLFGAFLGTVTGRAVVRFERMCPTCKSALLLRPVYSPGFSGMTASARF